MGLLYKDVMLNQLRQAVGLDSMLVIRLNISRSSYDPRVIYPLLNLPKQGDFLLDKP